MLRKEKMKFYATKVLRYIISNFLLFIIYYAIGIVISQIWREFFYISADDINNPRYAAKQMIGIIMNLASFIIFFIIYSVRYLYRDKSERKQFLAEAKSSYNWKDDLISHLKNSGKNEIITYTVFSFIFFIVMLINSMSLAIFSAIYFFQTFFYEIIPFPIVGFVLNIIIFTLFYSIAIVIIHKKWYKVYYIKHPEYETGMS